MSVCREENICLIVSNRKAKRLLIGFSLLMLNLSAFPQNRYDVLITEFLADPTPPVGLPESEFIELANHSSFSYHLQNWKISNGNSTAVFRDDYILKPDSFLIVCSTKSLPAFSTYGAAIGVSGFPALNNSNGEIILMDDEDVVIYALQYDKSWFRNDIKAGGGWSLEMIDQSDPCAGKSNWTASVSPTGGTPGKMNSSSENNPDQQPPSLLRAVDLDSLNLMLFFDKPVDSSSASVLSNYQISDGIGTPGSASEMPPFFNQIKITLPRQLQKGKTYTVSVGQIQDCSGNEMNQVNSCKAGLTEKTSSGDIIFNEILFNPPTNGYDYIELYNRSSKTIDCSSIFLATRDGNGNIKDPASLMLGKFSLFPGEYLLVTENSDWIMHEYPNADASRISEFASMPSMPDDTGVLLLQNTEGEILDELHYDHHWHSPLVANEEGVALERIYPDQPTNLSSNWTSAAAAIGYGTPGFKNSESAPVNGGSDFISIEPKVFSPDMDGHQDFLFIHYHLPAPGFIGSISIYDIRGNLVSQPVNNILWGVDGTFRWDGLDNHQNPLPMGRYVVLAELFSPDGKVRIQKMVCALMRQY